MISGRPVITLRLQASPWVKSDANHAKRREGSDTISRMKTIDEQVTRGNEE